MKRYTRFLDKTIIVERLFTMPDFYEIATLPCGLHQIMRVRVYFNIWFNIEDFWAFSKPKST